MTDSNRRIAYVTKYALTVGIQKMEVETTKYGVYQVRNGDMFFCSLGKGNVHDSLESAISAADKMRTKKIASLKKQIVKLENMEFEVSDDGF